MTLWNGLELPEAYYKDDDVYIIHGDCREVLPNLLDKSVDLVLTDPPYSTPVITSFGRKQVKNYGDLSIQKYYLESLEKELANKIVESGSVLFHCDDAYAGILFAVFYHWHICQYLVWDKGRIGMGRPFRRQHELLLFASSSSNMVFQNGKTLATVLRYSTIPSKERLHGAQKPTNMTADLIDALVLPNSIVLDPFLGSGTTAVAAKKLGRKCIGIEISEEYCQIAAIRCIKAGVEMRENE